MLYSLAKFFHHCDELFEGDLSVAILVHLLDNLIDSRGREGTGSAESQHVTDLVGRDNARPVLVEHLEGSLQLVVGGELALVHRSHHKLRVVNVPTAVCVHGVEHFLHVLVREDLSVVINVARLDLVHVKFAVAVLVEGAEHTRQVVPLLLGQQLRGNERVRGLLQGLVHAEVLHVVQHGQGQRLVNLE